MVAVLAAVALVIHQVLQKFTILSLLHLQMVDDHLHRELLVTSPNDLPLLALLPQRLSCSDRHFHCNLILLVFRLSFFGSRSYFLYGFHFLVHFGSLDLLQVSRTCLLQILLDVFWLYFLDQGFVIWVFLRFRKDSSLPSRIQYEPAQNVEIFLFFYDASRIAIDQY